MKTLQIRIEKEKGKYNIVSEAFNGTESVCKCGGNVRYSLDTSEEAEKIRKKVINDHNECEKINPSKISRKAIAV